MDIKNSKTITQEKRKELGKYLPRFLAPMIKPINEYRKEVIPNQYRKHYITGEDIKLPRRSSRLRIIKGMLNTYYTNSHLEPMAFIPRVERWRLIIVINILCFIANREKPHNAFKQALNVAARILNGMKGQPKRLKKLDWEDIQQCKEVFGQLSGYHCPNCGEILTDVATEIESDWHKIQSDSNIDKYGQFKHNINTTS